MVQTRPWLAPVVVGVFAAALLIASGLYFTHPGGVVIRVGTAEHWKLTHAGADGVEYVIASGTGPPANDHIQVKPGIYWVTTPQSNQPNCPVSARYRVRPHQWTTKVSGFAAPSCAVQ
jgi:hypothetical protein